jgi:hypothetical protein
LAKSDIKISKLRNLPTTTNITSLGGIDVTSASTYPDGYAIISKDAPNHRLYILNRSSTDTPDNDQFVASNVSGVVWERIMGTQIATNDLRGTFDVTLNPAQYPKGDSTTAVNATQVGNGSGVGPTIMAGDFWYVINNGTGTKTVGPTPKQILTNNAIILALVDNATNSDADWIILEASAGSDLAPNVASLRTLGTGAQQAAAGNDERFADARTPTTHAASHKHGGSDEIATATPAANEIPKANGTGKLDAWITGASESAPGIIEIGTQGETDAGVDDSRAITALKLATNPRLPLQTENDALQGTNGTPSNANRYVTDSDPRNTNARTPVGTALTAAQIWVGSAGNVAAAVAVTGDITLSNAGVVAIPSTFITGKTAVTVDSGDYLIISDTSDSGNLKKILVSSLPAGSSALTNSFIFVGNGSNVATGVAMSGDATITNTGVVTIANSVVSNAKIRNSSGLSVIGRSVGSSGVVGDITATTNGDVLQMVGGVLAFAPLGGGSAHVIQYNTVAQTQRANLNFTGAGVVITDDAVNNRTTVTIAGGGGGSYTDEEAQDAVGGILNSSQFTYNDAGPSITLLFGTTAGVPAEGDHTHAFSDLTTKPTTLSGYGITDAISSTLTSARILVGNGSNIATSVALSGDATISNTGVLTLATVNSNVGSFNNFIVNAKGLITAASTIAYLTANQTITLSSDVTGSGTTAITATIGTNVVTNTKLAQMSALSVKVNATNATANAQDLAASTAYSTLVRNNSNALVWLTGLTTNYMATYAAKKVWANVSNVVAQPIETDLLDISTMVFKRVTTATSYSADGTEHIIGVTSTAAARVITLSAAINYIPSQVNYIVDESNAASTNNITVAFSGADTSQGSTTINTNGGKLAFYSDGVSKFFFI